ncbi:MAG: hypothetical protein DSZ05_08090 [Sulfurospirillum sp.]|nr:MAG: hypothetical protein DSZ05_08090 [Sulfurospirillum sp.]
MRKKIYLSCLIVVPLLFSGCGGVVSDSMSQEDDIESIAIQQERLDGDKGDVAAKIDINEINHIQEKLAAEEGAE